MAVSIEKTLANTVDVFCQPLSPSERVTYFAWSGGFGLDTTGGGFQMIIFNYGISISWSWKPGGLK